MKVLLILIDGMRPDSLDSVQFAQEFMKKCTYTLNAKTVLPSDTLPCHMSLFHSVDPDVHKTTTNTFNSGANTVKGLCEILHDNGKKSAFFYNWGELRDLAKPWSLVHSCFVNGDKVTFATASSTVTDYAIDYLSKNDVDFTFLYMGTPDAVGHGKGWMTEEYLLAVKNSWENVERILATLSDDYAVLITADHGGHDRGHGTNMKEDVTIPLFIKGVGVDENKQIDGVSIKDIAPTIVKLLGVEPDSDWSGKSVL